MADIAGTVRQRLRRPRLTAGFQWRSDRSLWSASQRPPYLAFAGLTLFVFVAIFAPLLSPMSPVAIDLRSALQPPLWFGRGSTAHVLGTDELGRDVLSRIIHGTRPALIVAVSSVAIAALVGSAVGVVAAYWSGWVDQVLMRIVDIMLSFPAMLLALLLAARLGPGLGNVIIVISLILWSSYARQVRGHAMVVVKQDYVLLARAGGRGALGIMLRHVLPNVVNTIIVMATLQVGVVIVLEASLSFLGVGVPPPDPTWGGMVSEGRGLIERAWWLSVLPGLAVLGLVLAVNVVGGWMESYLDPRRRSR